MLHGAGLLPEQGQLAQVRSRPWVVNDVKPSTLPVPALASPVTRPQHLLALSSVEDDGLGEPTAEEEALRKKMKTWASRAGGSDMARLMVNEVLDWRIIFQDQPLRTT